MFTTQAPRVRQKPESPPSPWVWEAHAAVGGSRHRLARDRDRAVRCAGQADDQRIRQRSWSAGGHLGSGREHLVRGRTGEQIGFAEGANPGRIGRITPAGSITEFSKGLSRDRSPEALASGSDGNLYFTETGGSGEIGKITPDGAISELTHDSQKAPFSLATGTDGNLWFTEPEGDRDRSCHDRAACHHRPRLRDHHRRRDARRYGRPQLPADDVSLRLGSHDRVRIEHARRTRRQRCSAADGGHGHLGTQGLCELSLSRRREQCLGHDLRTGRDLCSVRCSRACAPRRARSAPRIATCHASGVRTLCDGLNFGRLRGVGRSLDLTCSEWYVSGVRCTASSERGLCRNPSQKAKAPRPLAKRTTIS